MTEEQILKKIHDLYSLNLDLNSFKQAINDLQNNQNEYIKKAFMLASLRLIEAERFKTQEPVLANLLCYIAVETLSNNLAYFNKTGGIRHSDFKINYKIEAKINKTQEFQNFLLKYSDPILQKQVKFEKQINNSSIQAPFNDVLRYLYLRNRCVIVHKGIFRTVEGNCSLTDVFIDEKGVKSTITIEIPGGNLTQWFYELVKDSFMNFLNQNTKTPNNSIHWTQPRP
ncbi:MAG: hypothetical protein JSV30_00455 [Candidatus Omnitrophota bacterium]|nr:MAG: hypothetical protein JSV30_00455 [Candidatus Omnitrophota bacterium]